MNTSDVNIHTIEDPIEYELDDLNQTQVNHQRELSYERVLRSLLRQDPDIIMVGEIRDRETAEAATNAALTGHLVLSTVHSLSALKAVRRLTQMGVPSYMVAESLILLQAQRLVRKLCDCKRPISLSKLQAKQFEQHAPHLCDHLSSIHEPGGCSACLNTGFKGRLALMELCPIDDALGEMIAEGATTIELHRAASDAGFRSLFTEALDHCAKGDISFDVAMELSQAW
jgi:type II secretory ATPase GspE/PulE/Tfp pilus assembly ATPase PilB-like protein